MQPTKHYRIAVDIGGTFVDAIEFDETSGAVRMAKAAATPENPERGVIEAIRRLGTRLAETAVVDGGTGLNAAVIKQGQPLVCMRPCPSTFPC
jgi:N-methylhydantoinase A